MKASIAVILFFLSAQCIYAASLESPRFRIDAPSIDLVIPSDSQTPSDKPLSPKEREFEQKGYRLGEGADTIEFKISQTAVTYGPLSANTFIEKETAISYIQGRPGYTVYLSQQRNLTKNEKDTIPATSCNSVEACTSSFARTWTSLSSYGLGYTVKGSDVADDFGRGTRYRSFKTSSQSPFPSAIIRGIGQVPLREATIVFKLNTSPAQPEGTYEHIIDIIGLPGY